MCRDAADIKIRSIDPVFATRTEKIHDNPQDIFLLDRGLNSGPPEYKSEISIILEQKEVSVTSCVLPTFRRTTP